MILKQYKKKQNLIEGKYCWVNMFYLANAATTKGKTAASVPPVTIKSASPFLINLDASPIACAPAEQAVDGARFGP